MMVVCFLGVKADTDSLDMVQLAVKILLEKYSNLWEIEQYRSHVDENILWC